MAIDVKQIGQKIEAESGIIRTMRQEIGKVIVGQSVMVDRLILGLLCNGHILLEGVPGLAKSLSVSTLAQTMHAEFKRIQFTPDLLPSDLLGTLVFNPKDSEFKVKKGPIFANLILADEINRAPSKVQSALLEAMQERQVTIGDESFKLPEPFLVLATQNPIEQEGTYPLPEAQVDRFMFKVVLDYPSRDEERQIMDSASKLSRTETVEPVLKPEDIHRLRELVDEIYIEDALKDYMVDLVLATRRPQAFGLGDLQPLLDFGAGPRATIMLVTASKGHAFIDGRPYVTPQDIKAVAMDILRHRVIPSYEAEAEEMAAEDLVQRILDAVPVP